MANDLFGGLGNLGGALGGLMGGLAKSGLVPQDTPEGKLLAAQSELSDLKKQENEILLEIGRKAYDSDPSAWPQDAKMKLIRQNIASAEATLQEAKAAQEAADAAKAAEDAIGRCPSCGCKNPEGIKFCQECGQRLGETEKPKCVACGAELTPGIRFCGECGANTQAS